MKNPFNFDGKRILITGASAGIGRATAELLDSLGAEIILVGRDQEKLDGIRDTLPNYERHSVALIDLNNIDDINKSIMAIAETKPINGLVHCAGVHSAKPLRILDTSEMNRVMNLNVNAAVGLVKAFRNRKVHGENSSVVLISSVVGQVGQAGIAAYAASKGAVIALTKSLSVELAKEKMRINCVAPAVVMTDMTKKLFSKMNEGQIQAVSDRHLLGLGEPIDVAYSIAFLLADSAKWITGSVLNVDGGYTAH